MDEEKMIANVNMSPPQVYVVQFGQDVNTGKIPIAAFVRRNGFIGFT